ncbi:hypothetical protein FACS189413_11010 [Bacteroidia bacterium]|nr:hypothetical protein FACS189413_11010 [Bacteroidia bacterium]
MRRIIYKILLLSAILSICFQAFAQTTLWVAPKSSGVEFSEDTPGSLSGNSLKDRIIALRRSGERNIQVRLKSGVYSLDIPVVVDNEMAGSPKDTLSFVGLVTDSCAKDGKAILSGGRQVTGWKKAGKGIYKAQLPEGADFRQLYVNGQPAIRARHPNRDNDTDYGPYWRIQTLTNNDNDAMLKIKSSEYKHWSNLQEVEIVLNQHWYQCRLKINAVEEQGDQTLVTGSLRTSDWGEKEVPYYWENSLDFLDAEREWYFDKQTRWLYYKPQSGEDIKQVEVIYPAMNRLFSIEGTVDMPVQNVSVRNIELAYSNWTAPGIKGMVATQAVQPRYGVEVESMIQVNYADKVQITNCNIFCVGGNGIAFLSEVNHSYNRMTK